MNNSNKNLGIVWWLWNQITNPAYYHAVFTRFRRTPLVGDEDTSLMDALRFLLHVIVILGFIYIVWRNPALLLTTIFIPPIIGMSVVFLPVIAPFVNLAFGSLIAVNIASILQSERAKHTYELVTSTPAGALPVNWYAATGLLYRGQHFNWLMLMMKAVIWIPIIVICTVGIIILLFFRTPEVMVTATQFFFNMLIFTGGLYINFMQLILVSVIVGLLIPSFELPADEVRFTTLFIYLAIQIGSYTLTGFTIAMMHIAFYGQFIWLDWLLPIAYCGITYLMMEIVVRSLFRLLVYRLNASLEDDLAIIGARSR